MVIKLKICGNATISDILELDKLDVDYIGIITDPISTRFVKTELLSIIKGRISKPIVSVKVNGNITDLLKELEIVDYLQIHRVLNDKELEILKSYNTKRIIFYVPASREYKGYFKKVVDFADLILVDSLIKGVSVDLEVVKELFSEYPHLGVGGKINLDNIYQFITFNPKWIDISSSIEIYPGKKSLDKVKKLVEVVKHGSLSNK